VCGGGLFGSVVCQGVYAEIRTRQDGAAKVSNHFPNGVVGACLRRGCRHGVIRSLPARWPGFVVV